MLISTEHEARDDYRLEQLIKLGNITFEAHVHEHSKLADGIYPVSITGSYGKIKFHVGEKELYRWNIQKIVAHKQVQAPLEFGIDITFATPKSFTKEDLADLPEGRYLAKYICLRDFEVRHGVMRHNFKCGSVEGMFYFDMKRDYRLLSVLEIK